MAQFEVPGVRDGVARGEGWGVEGVGGRWREEIGS